MASDKKFYEQLNTLKVEDAPATTIQLMSNPVHLQESNKAVLDAIIQVNKATLRSDGGPIPGTGQVKKVDIAADTTGHTSVFQPEKGEVWLISTISVVPTATGTIACSVSLVGEDSGARATLDAGTGSVTTSTIIDMVNGPVYLSYECYLDSYISTNTNGVTYNIGCHRVR